MKLKVNAVHFNADSSLIDFLQKKVDKLETFYDKIISAEVYLKLEKGDSSKIQKKEVEVKLYVPGNTIFVKEEGTSFEEAIDLTMDVLTRKVKRVKQKQHDISHTKPDAMGVVEEEEETIIEED